MGCHFLSGGGCHRLKKSNLKKKIILTATPGTSASYTYIFLHSATVIETHKTLNQEDSILDFQFSN